MYSYYTWIDIWQFHAHWNLTNTKQIPENYYGINLITSWFQLEFLK